MADSEPIDEEPDTGFHLSSFVKDRLTTDAQLIVIDPVLRNIAVPWLSTDLDPPSVESKLNPGAGSSSPAASSESERLDAVSSGTVKVSSPVKAEARTKFSRCTKRTCMDKAAWNSNAVEIMYNKPCPESW
jgi:hypothetical protein